ncbi:MAG: hypothetical protein WC241_01600 [Candidatus Paceibacterota bacterium]|jgi:hypothetical protein
MEQPSIQNESLSLDQILSLTDAQINLLSKDQVESAQYLLKKNNLVTVEADGPVGKDFHPAYSKLGKRLHMIENPESD